MISEYLNRDHVLQEIQSQHDRLVRLLQDLDARVVRAVRLLKQRKIRRQQVELAVAALARSLEQAKADPHAAEIGYIPSDPLLCGYQTVWTHQAFQAHRVVAASGRTSSRSAAARTVRRAVAGTGKGPAKVAANDASPEFKLARPAPGPRVRRIAGGGFIENDDVHYGLDGFFAKTSALFGRPRKFNPQPARAAVAARPLRLYLFGDWGTGLPLAKRVADAIRRQIDASDGARQQHVIHLGDVYYVGEPYEYHERMLGPWPVPLGQAGQVGSWSLNGNHDRYSGGHGYFDTLLQDPRFQAWQTDAKGKPSSYFRIEDAHWQVFGLDSAWKLPSFGKALLSTTTLQDSFGQNGILTEEQVAWMKQVRDPSKGCVLLTHHPAAASRTDESQHSDQAVHLLKQAGLYRDIDAWIWGHEHRAVVYKPRRERTDPRLRQAPPFCACLGHGGVPVPEKNFARARRKPDVLWEEDRLDSQAPLYEGRRVVPFGFGRLDLDPETIDFRIFDHHGVERYASKVTR